MIANAIEALTRRMPPPERPVEAKGNWRTVEKNFGMRFPSDFKALIKTYGTGNFFDLIWFFNPFSENPNLNLYRSVARKTRALKKHGMTSLAEYPDDPFLRTLVAELDDDLIFPCGATDNGDDIFWRIDGPPDRWGIAVLNFRDHESQNIRLSLTQFLLAITKERLNCTLFPELALPLTSSRCRPVGE